MMVRMIIGSAAVQLILLRYLAYFFLLPATVSTMSAAPTIEAATATIGRQDRTATAPTTSTSTVVRSTWATTIARTGSLSVAFR